MIVIKTATKRLAVRNTNPAHSPQQSVPPAWFSISMQMWQGSSLGGYQSPLGALSGIKLQPKRL